MYKKLLGTILAISLATCSFTTTTARGSQLRTCNYADAIIEEVKENNMLIAESITSSKPAGQYVLMAYLQVNAEILKDLRTWKVKNCKEA